MDAITIFYKVIMAMCFALSIASIIGCVILMIIGKWIDRIICPMAIATLIIVIFVTWKVLVS